MTIFSYTITPPRRFGRSSGLLWARDYAEALRRLDHPDAKVTQIHPLVEPYDAGERVPVRPRRLALWYPRGETNLRQSILS
jgi:uncharacterized protein YbjT (DUF2867 family)